MKFLMLSFLLLPVLLSGQERGDRLRFVFYNVENLFDPFDDSLTADEEFLPGGARGWTWNRFEDKLNRIHKALIALGGWMPPDVIGLCEVENYLALHRLVNETPLRKYEYRVIHEDSPDRRGMDVALLYRSGVFREIRYRYYRVPGSGADRGPTRDILYVKGMLEEGRSLHMLVNHWPSRWGGTIASRPGRLAAAAGLRHILDSIFMRDIYASILVAGDFNDEITNSSLRDGLGVRLPGSLRSYDGLYLPSDGKLPGVPGSLKYQGRWYVFDLILVSRTLLEDPALCVSREGYRVFAPDFLLEEDPQWLGSRPFRTFRGYRYHGGFSDHLPVYIDLVRNDACWSGIRYHP